jgi:cytochrome c-type biogenesis protein CcmE
MRKSTRRLILIGFAGALLIAAAALALRGFRDSIVYFYGPSEIAAKAAPGQHVRLGGLVAAGSVHRGADGALLFLVTDGTAEVPVRFAGAPPDLFRGKKGVVAEGRWTAQGVFQADQILAKHDENYMPKEVVEELKTKKGMEWRGN